MLGLLPVELCLEIAHYLDIWDAVAFVQSTSLLYMNAEVWRAVLLEKSKSKCLACPVNTNITSLESADLRKIGLRTASIQKNLSSPKPVCKSVISFPNSQDCTIGAISGSGLHLSASLFRSTFSIKCRDMATNTVVAHLDATFHDPDRFLPGQFYRSAPYISPDGRAVFSFVSGSEDTLEAVLTLFCLNFSSKESISLRELCKFRILSRDLSLAEFNASYVRLFPSHGVVILRHDSPGISGYAKFGYNIGSMESTVQVLDLQVVKCDLGVDTNRAHEIIFGDTVYFSATQVADETTLYYGIDLGKSYFRQATLPYNSLNENTRTQFSAMFPDCTHGFFALFHCSQSAGSGVHERFTMRRIISYEANPGIPHLRLQPPLAHDSDPFLSNNRAKLDFMSHEGYQALTSHFCNCDRGVHLVLRRFDPGTSSHSMHDLEFPPGFPPNGKVTLFYHSSRLMDFRLGMLDVSGCDGRRRHIWQY